VSNHPGFFVVFEGGDGAGKSTQVKKLTQKLEALNETVVLTREPGGTELGKKIREILLDQDEFEVTPRMEALLFAADRSINMSQNIKPALEKGFVVIADRHIDSSIAYQGVGRGLGANTIEDISRFTYFNSICKNEKLQILQSSVYIEMKWVDKRLSWEQNQFENISHISLPTNMIWVEIFLFKLCRFSNRL
jgi:dTMP kinase